MIQGGDPTGTGQGGESAFEDGRPFRDEFVSKLVHQVGLGAGLMAGECVCMVCVCPYVCVCNVCCGVCVCVCVLVCLYVLCV